MKRHRLRLRRSPAEEASPPARSSSTAHPERDPLRLLQSTIGNRATSALLARQADTDSIQRKVVPASVKGVRIGKTRVYDGAGKVAGRVGKGAMLMVDWADSPPVKKTVNGNKALIKITKPNGVELSKGADTGDLWISNTRVTPSGGTTTAVVEEQEQQDSETEEAPLPATKETDTSKENVVEPLTEEPKEPDKKKDEGPKQSPLSLAGGQKILEDAFGKVKKIVPGKIEILPTDKFAEAYDAIYGSGPYSWAKYVVPTFGGLNGFAYNNVNYINSDSAGLHTVVHEMLHNNVALEFRATVGSSFDEGMTELLTQDACAKANEDAPTCYPGETPVVQSLISKGLSKETLQDAYFSGGAQAKVAAWIDLNCKDNFLTFKSNFEAKNFVAALAGLAKK